MLVTLPVAPDVEIVPVLLATRPPMKLFAPPEMAPLASDSEMVPGFEPTSPPALFVCEPVLELPTVTATFACELVMAPNPPPGPKFRSGRRARRR